MAFVIARRDGRFEVRESIATSAGPRARTLATFRTLSPGVLDQAEARATRPFNRDAIAERARMLGAPEELDDVPHRLAWRLLKDLGSGGRLPDVLAAALRAELGLGHPPLPDTIPPLLDWLAASPRERGEALRDLLCMTDNLPPRRTRQGRRFPRIASAQR